MLYSFKVVEQKKPARLMATDYPTAGGGLLPPAC
jgi:hypothetical protein